MSTHGPSNKTASTPEYRRPLFAVGRRAVPVTEGKPPVESGTSSYGRVRVIRGGVTQHHRDLLDAIRATAEYRIVDAAGQEHLIFDVVRVCEILPSRIHWRDIRRDLHDLLSTVVQIEGTPGNWGAAFPIATFVGDANSPAARAPHQFPARLKRLVLSAGFTGLLEQHATISLNRQTVKNLLSLQHAVSRAVARWCLAHSGDQHHALETVFAALGIIQPGEPITGRAARRQTRRYVQQLFDDAAGLASLGIEIDSERRLHYRRRTGVFITAPAQPVDANPPVVDANPPVVDANPPVS